MMDFFFRKLDCYERECKSVNLETHLFKLLRYRSKLEAEVSFQIVIRRMLESPHGGGTASAVRWFARTRQAIHPFTRSLDSLHLTLPPSLSLSLFLLIPLVRSNVHHINPSLTLSYSLMYKHSVVVSLFLSSLQCQFHLSHYTYYRHCTT